MRELEGRDRPRKLSDAAARSTSPLHSTSASSRTDWSYTGLSRRLDVRARRVSVSESQWPLVLASVIGRKRRVALGVFSDLYNVNIMLM